jgi:4-hydroxy-tetrahydrodipicolinate reductase
VAVFRRLLQQIPAFFRDACDIEITETHHSRKADAPSGTAKLLVQALDPDGLLTPVYGREGQTGARRKDEIGIHALRGGTVSGDHTVYFFGEDEVLEITHRAASRQIFVNGALGAAQALVGRPNGFYTLEQLLFGEGGQYDGAGNHRLYCQFREKDPRQGLPRGEEPIDFGMAQVFGAGAPDRLRRLEHARAHP